MVSIALLHLDLARELTRFADLGIEGEETLEENDRRDQRAELPIKPNEEAKKVRTVFAMLLSV